jgi:hypothetical protein
MSVILEPASAVAAGICIAARTIGSPPGILRGRHPRPCGWCDYPVDELRRLVDEHNAWAGFSERSRTYERHDARVFAELPAATQAELVLAAQDFPALEPEPQPERDPDPLPAFLRGGS